ncbi:NUDIX hydrolase [Candidatus Saccharibacteria bacterium]|jgi:ADP-ribose pyrophosphatase YjhB (NUDIX family)|nr:NUDIX hydrolase [Candidatus Saccharibacteria bacterium]MBP9813160.1 NUDIX hydrolase [Candidatus Saccharibacteria bacterium]
MNENYLLAHIGQYALIKNNENKVLLLERVRSRTWCLPGGRLNENEEWDVALLREMKEEIGLECSNPKPFAVNILKDDYQTKYCAYFTLVCSNVSTLQISTEHSNLGWFASEDIKNLEIEDNKVKTVVLDYLDQY